MDGTPTLWLFACALAGALQGGGGIALTALARRRRLPPRWARALTWVAFAGACLIAYGVWQDGVGWLVALLRSGGATTLIALVIFVPTLAISGALAPLWLAVAVCQRRPGRAYRAALRATLPLVVPVAGLAVALLMGFAAMAAWLVVFGLLAAVRR